MLLINLKFPKEEATKIATFMAEKAIVGLVSYTEQGDGLFTKTYIRSIVAAPDELKDAIATEWKAWIQK